MFILIKDRKILFIFHISHFYLYLGMIMVRTGPVRFIGGSIQFGSWANRVNHRLSWFFYSILDYLINESQIVPNSSL